MHPKYLPWAAPSLLPRHPRRLHYASDQRKERRMRAEEKGGATGAGRDPNMHMHERPPPLLKAQVGGGSPAPLPSLLLLLPPPSHPFCPSHSPPGLRSRRPRPAAPRDYLRQQPPPHLHPFVLPLQRSLSLPSPASHRQYGGGTRLGRQPQGPERGCPETEVQSLSYLLLRSLFFSR